MGADIASVASCRADLPERPAWYTTRRAPRTDPTRAALIIMGRLAAGDRRGVQLHAWHRASLLHRGARPALGAVTGIGAMLPLAAPRRHPGRHRDVGCGAGDRDPGRGAAEPP